MWVIEYNALPVCWIKLNSAGELDVTYGRMKATKFVTREEATRALDGLKLSDAWIANEIR